MKQEQTQVESIAIVKSSFGKMPSGEEVSLYTLTNKNGVEVKITNYGGIVTSVLAPDKNGVIEDVVLGYDKLEDYLHDSPYFGAIVGRYANRIAKGKFTLEGKEYTLALNNGLNTLHGGLKGFDKVLWNVEVLAEKGALKLSYTSPDMEEGFPGTLRVDVICTLSNNDELKFDFTATTDKTTVLNLTQHTYFNLTGDLKRDILAHELQINADAFVAVDSNLIPTGTLQPVAHTPFDFTTTRVVGARINDNDEQIELGLGYDHCYALRSSSEKLKHAATLSEPVSGRTVDVFTTEPGMQFYSGNFLKGYKGKKGAVYNKRFGLCLETEHFPDSPNQQNFPSVMLKVGEVYETSTVYRFGVK